MFKALTYSKSTLETQQQSVTYFKKISNKDINQSDVT